VIDTDCELFMRCSSGRCVPLGDFDGGRDAGRVDAQIADGAIVDSGPTRVGTGVVSAASIPLDPGGMDFSTWFFSATFTRDDAIGPGTPCTTEDFGGGCALTVCMTPPPPADGGMPVDGGVVADAGMPVLDHAGMVSVSGATMPLQVTPGADGLYTAQTGTGLLFTDGATLTYAAVGDEVPTFGGNISSPGRLNITAPSFVTIPIPIDRAMGLGITWTMAGTADPGTLVVTLSAVEIPAAGGFNSYQIVCEAPGTSGSTSVPSAALMRLPAAATGSISFQTRSSLVTTPLGWEVTLVATATSTSDQSGSASAAITVP
jgi:hypothetical protein